MRTPLTLMTLVALFCTACGDDVSGPVPPADLPPLYYLYPPTNTGNGQSDTVLATLPNPFRMLVRRGDSPAPGITVLWQSLADSVTGFPGVSTSTVTDAAGIASFRLTFPRGAGTYDVYASVPGVVGRALWFTAHANPANPTWLRIVSGNDQTDTTNTPLNADYTVRATDSYNNGWGGIVIDWAVTAGGGSITPTQNATGASGFARARHTLGPTTGAHTVTATASTLPGEPQVTFTATAFALGSVRVATATTGIDPDADGYSALLDGVTRDTSVAIATNGTTTISGLLSGDYSVALGGVAMNCSVNGQIPRALSVPADDTAEVVFAVTCAALGNVLVPLKVATTGVDLDPNGYTARATGPGFERTVAVPVNGAVTITVNAPGTYTLALAGVTVNCAVAGANPQTITVPTSGADTVVFDVACETDTQLAFVSVVDGDNLEIYVVKSNGTGLTRLTFNTTYDFSPAWSPDGSKIAFSRDGGYQRRDIYVMNADGSSQIRLTGGDGFYDMPSWSPDGTKIAFTSQPYRNSDIYVMNADGSNPVRLTVDDADPAYDFSPAWSPDGARIAFSSDRAGVEGAESSFDIYVINADGSNPVRLTNTGGNSEPAWSPDGMNLAFTHWGCSESCDYDLFAMNADGSGIVQVTSGYPWEFDAAWSRGGWIAFATRNCSSHPCNDPIAIAAVRPNGTDRREILGGPVSHPAWRP